MAVTSPRRPRVDRTTLTGLAVVLVLFVVSLLLGEYVTALHKLELGLTDIRYRQFPRKFGTVSSPIVIVDINDESDEALDAVWPWPRSYYARLLDNVFRAGARAVVLDIIFDGPRVDDVPGDDSLSAALARYAGKVVLGGKTWVPDEDRPGVQVIYHSGGARVLKPHEPFLRASGGSWGLTDVKQDIDGVIREYYTVRSVIEGDTLFPALAVRAFDMITGAPSRHSRPLFRIAYPGPTRSYFSYYSFYHVIDDSTYTTNDEIEWEEEQNFYDTLLSEGRLQDRIVFVGSSMAEAHDMKLTPFSRAIGGQGQEAPGVEVHAAALHTLLNGFRIADADPVRWYAALLGVCAVLFVAGSLLPTWVYVSAAGLAAATWVVVSFGMYAAHSVLVPTATPLFTLLLTTLGQQGYLFYREQMRRRQVVGMFGKFVPPDVVNELVRDPTKAKLSGERRELTVLFTDVEGFTSVAETMEPEQVAALLNEYLTPMTDIVVAQGGIIDKYEGDLIMAEFGIPLAMPDHALRACQTAFLMQKRLYELHDTWRSQGKPLLRARTGIGAGTMVFGNMGSTQVFDYTVLGDVVNLASRLEGVNKTYGTRILVNERTAELVKDHMLLREMDLLLVKGKHIPETCYQLMAPLDSPKADEIRHAAELFREGLHAYRAQQWDVAERLFSEVLEVWPDDRPSEVFIERCRVFRTSPPGEGWDGVFEMKTK